MENREGGKKKTRGSREIWPSREFWDFDDFAEKMPTSGGTEVSHVVTVISRSGPPAVKCPRELKILFKAKRSRLEPPEFLRDSAGIRRERARVTVYRHACLSCGLL